MEWTCQRSIGDQYSTAGVEGACGSVGDHWKGLRIGKTMKCFWNQKVVRVQRMLKVSEVRLGKTPRSLWSGKEAVS